MPIGRSFRRRRRRRRRRRAAAAASNWRCCMPQVLNELDQ